MEESELQIQLDEANDEITELRDELESYEREVYDLKDENEDLEKKVEELENQIEELEDKLNNNTEDETLYDIQKSEILEELRELSLSELEILRDNYKEILI